VRTDHLLVLLAVVGLGLSMVACDDAQRSFAGFDGPTDVALLPPGTFFEVPVALVSNFRSGRVSKLDLKRTNLVVEDSPAPWMPSADLSFGADRALSHLALAVTEDTVEVWAADDSRDELLRLPWILGLGDDSKPIWSHPGIGEVSAFDPGGAPRTVAAPSLRNLRLDSGRATTETWTLTWQGSGFVVRGSASGLQDSLAVPGSPYVSDRSEVSFTPALDGVEPPDGAYLEFSVFSGVEGAPSGGLVTDLHVALDGAWIFATVLPEDGPAWLSVWDATAFVELDRWEFPAGAAPESIAAGKDEGVLWVADSSDVNGEGRFWRFDYVPGDIDTLAAVAIDAPEPSIDVAEGRGGRHHLMVASAFSERVWTLDGATYATVDINPVTPEVDPTILSSLIVGLAATVQPAATQDLDLDGDPLFTHMVVATTFSGQLFLLDAESGCQIFGLPGGSYVEEPSNLDDAFVDTGAPSDPVTIVDAATLDLVTTHPCGGVSESEDWVVTYDSALASYEVEGSLSGIQQNRLFEGERYVSDNGSISMLILPGNSPTTDGDLWAFAVNDGVTPIAMQMLPSDPLIYTELYDDRSGSWFKVREREVAVVAHSGDDVVLWMDLAGQGSGGVRVYQ
jgi:hypothetical protein